MLNTNDVRQFIVYGEWHRRRLGLTDPPDVAIFYAFVGAGTFAASKAVAFNGSRFWMVPVRVKRMARPSGGIPPLVTTQKRSESRHPVRSGPLSVRFSRFQYAPASAQDPNGILELLLQTGYTQEDMLVGHWFRQKNQREDARSSSKQSARHGG